MENLQIAAPEPVTVFELADDLFALGVIKQRRPGNNRNRRLRGKVRSLLNHAGWLACHLGYALDREGPKASQAYPFLFPFSRVEKSQPSTAVHLNSRGASHVNPAVSSYSERKDKVGRSHCLSSWLLNNWCLGPNRILTFV